MDEVEKASQPAAPPGPVVQVQPERPSLFAQFQRMVGRFLGVFSAAGMVLLLVICMLVGRENLRNQLIHLAGSGRLVLTTRALDETSQRIGRYLLGQSLNAGFGVAVGLGLFLIGVPCGICFWGRLASRSHAERGRPRRRLPTVQVYPKGFTPLHILRWNKRRLAQERPGG